MRAPFRVQGHGYMALKARGSIRNYRSPPRVSGTSIKSSLQALQRGVYPASSSIRQKYLFRSFASLHICTRHVHAWPFRLAAHAEHLCRRKAKQLGNAANLVILALSSGRRCAQTTVHQGHLTPWPVKSGNPRFSSAQMQPKLLGCISFISAGAHQQQQMQLGDHKSMALEYGRPNSTSGDLEIKKVGNSQHHIPNHVKHAWCPTDRTATGYRCASCETLHTPNRNQSA